MKRIFFIGILISGIAFFACSKPSRHDPPKDPGPIIENVLEGWASWSPDGRYIAYSRSSRDEEEFIRYGPTSIWVYDFQTAKYGFLVGPGNFPEWSPDGTILAFEYGYNIGFFYLQERTIRQVTHTGGIAVFGWSPRGDQLLVNRQGCWIVDTLGNQIRNVAPMDSTPGFWQTIQSSDWGPSGDKILISRKNSITIFDIITVDTLGNFLQTLASDPDWQACDGLNWSPDAMRFTASVSYFGTDRNPEEVRVYDIPSQSFNIISDPAGMGEWSPDGTQIAHQKYTWMAPSPDSSLLPDIGRVTVWVSNADGSNAHELLGWPQVGFDSTMFGGGYSWLDPRPPQ